MAITDFEKTHIGKTVFYSETATLDARAISTFNTFTLDTISSRDTSISANAIVIDYEVYVDMDQDTSTILDDDGYGDSESKDGSEPNDSAIFKRMADIITTEQVSHKGTADVKIIGADSNIGIGIDGASFTVESMIDVPMDIKIICSCSEE
jgi:hypothetical protein